MANKTQNYNLTQPLETEFYDINVQNENMEKIDRALKGHTDQIFHLQEGQKNKADLDESGKIPSSQLPEFTGVLPVSKGGTGNSDGYVRAGQKNETAIGDKATAEGYDTTASGRYSHAEGYRTTASGPSSHAEGVDTIASGGHCHAEGNCTIALYNMTHAEGNYTTASGTISHSEGNGTTASASYSHSEGHHTTASNLASHAGGKRSKPMTNGDRKSVV